MVIVFHVSVLNPLPYQFALRPNPLLHPSADWTTYNPNSVLFPRGRITA